MKVPQERIYHDSTIALLVFGCLGALLILSVLLWISVDEKERGGFTLSKYRILLDAMLLLVYIGVLILSSIIINSIREEDNGLGLISVGGGIIVLLVFSILFSIITFFCEMFGNGNILDCYNIPEGFVRIESYAFSHYKKLKYIFIPSSITGILNFAFYNCPFLSEFAFNGTIQQWNQMEKMSHWKDEAVTYTVHCTNGDIRI